MEIDTINSRIKQILQGCDQHLNSTLNPYIQDTIIKDTLTLVFKESYLQKRKRKGI